MKLLDSIEQEYIYKHGRAQIPYLIRVAKAAREAVDRWQDSGDGTYQNMEFAETMDRLEALLEEEA